MFACATEYTPAMIFMWKTQRSAFICFNIRTLVVPCFNFKSSQCVPVIFQYIRSSFIFILLFIFFFSIYWCPLYRFRIVKLAFVYNDEIIQAKQSTSCWLHTLKQHTHTHSFTHSHAHNDWCSVKKWHGRRVFRTAIIVQCSIQQWKMIYIYFVWF